MSVKALFSIAGKRVMVAGHRGMVGRALVRRLEAEECEIVTADRNELDMTRQEEVEKWMTANRPDVMFIAAARVGGIHANSTRPAEFLYDNLTIETNLIEAARKVGVQKLLFLASSCIYPREAPQPMNEDALLTGPLEPTNEGYGLAKIVGIKLCSMYRRQYDCDFVAAIPPNLYGPFDNFDPLTSHVIPGLIRRAHEAKLTAATAFTIWGTGSAKREFLHVDDAADGCLFLLKNYSGERPMNVGSGSEVTIRELAGLVCDTVGFTGKIVNDPSKPDGMPAKLMDNSRIAALGWKATIGLREGLASGYAWFLENIASAEK